ncbi:MAG TPA: site-2 protease family protein [Pseudonocardiaceae bacterium]|jgi:Zn-dependent protease|nr:site-2 protease family protein [Pseudonocardiaceae bacterium]
MRATTLAPSPVFVLLVTATVAGGGLAAVGTGPTRTAGIVLLVLGGWAVSLCLHEFGHALVAYRGGDRSVRAKGYLTLDIRRYTDPVLSLLLPLLLLVVGGIPLPGGAVWINHGALRSRAASSAVSLAGPLTNLALGVLLIAVVQAVTPPAGLAAGLSYLALVQLLAFVLNILPVPGLDGFGVLEPYLPARARQIGATVRPYAPLLLFVLIIGIPGLAAALFDPAFTLFDALGGNARAAAAGLREFLFWR